VGWHVIEQILATEEHDEAYFWATRDDAGIDLILVRAGQLVGVEIKRTDAPRLTPSIRNALADLGLLHVAVIDPGDSAFPSRSVWKPCHSRVFGSPPALPFLDAPWRRPTVLASESTTNLQLERDSLDERQRSLNRHRTVPGWDVWGLTPPQAVWVRSQLAVHGRGAV
jgi:hypothetical protein